MELTPYLDTIRDDIVRAGELGGDEVRAVVLRLLPAVDPAVRLALINALSDQARDITHQLESAGASALVQVQLEGRDPVTRVRTYQTQQADPAEPTRPAEGEVDDDGAAARITLRLPESLKTRAEAAAEAAGVSLNSYVVECVRRVTERREHPHGRGFPPPPPPHGAAGRAGWPRPDFTAPAPPPAEPPAGASRRLSGWL